MKESSEESLPRDAQKQRQKLKKKKSWSPKFGSFRSSGKKEGAQNSASAIIDDGEEAAQSENVIGDSADACYEEQLLTAVSDRHSAETLLSELQLIDPTL